MNLILTGNEELTMSSLDLLEIINNERLSQGGKTVRHNVFMNKIDDELEPEEYNLIVVLNSNNKEVSVASLSQDQCMLMAMRESKLVRRSVLSKLKKMDKPQIPQTFVQALELAVNQAKQLEEQAPKIAVYEQLADRKGDVSTTLLAKQLGTTAIKLNKFLRDSGVKMLRIDAPKAGYVEWFNVVSDVKNEHEFTQCLVTPLGQIEIAKSWGEK